MVDSGSFGRGEEAGPEPAIRVLGPVELAAEARVAVLAPGVRRLLAALTSRGGAVASTDWLVEAVWPQRRPQSADAALQTLVSRLRAALRRQAPEVGLLTRPFGYQLEVADDAVDAGRFTTLTDRARTAAEPDAAAELLQVALGLWRGDAYGEYAHEWFAETESARLAELHLAAQEHLAELLLQLGRAADALTVLTRVTRAHPLREGPHALLMRAQYRAGRTGEALETFAALRRRLADELGVDPGPALLQLQSDILRQAADHAAEDGPRDRVLAAPGRPWPYGAVELFGRERDRQELAQALEEERLVTVVGPGGLGKTALALAVASEVRERHADGATVCELTAIPADTPLPLALCTALGVTVTRAQEQEQLLAYLGERDLVLLLDNCEHLRDDVARLAAVIVRRCPRVRILATSRTSLRLPEERLFALQPLGSAHLDVTSASPDELRRDPAVRLFLARAEQRVRGFSADEASLVEIGRLCQRLDGLPLAIELAASCMDGLTPAQLVERLPWRLTVLRGGSARDPRHRTLRALADWSFDRLDLREQQLFEVVSVFADDFSLDDVEELVAGLKGTFGWGGADVVLTLTALVEQSMVVRLPHTSRYRLLETLRTYGRERLAAEAFAEQVPRAHARYFAALAVQGYEDFYGPGYLARVERLAGAMNELRAAFRWSVAEAPELAVELVGGLACLVEHKLLGEVAAWAVELTRVIPVAEWSPAMARVVAVAAAGARFGGDLDAATTWAQTAVELAVTDATARAYGLFLLVEAALFRGELDRAQAHWREVAVLADEHPRLLPLAQLVRCTALLGAAYAGDASGAEEAHEVQILAERRGWPVIAAWALYVRGEVVIDSQPERADELLQQALGRARALDERYLVGVTLVAAAAARARHGDPDRARPLFAEVVRLWRSRGDWTHQWTTLRNVVELLARVGRFEAATVLAAGLLDEGRPAAGFGSDAVRLRATFTALAERLGPERHRELVAEGLALGDEQLVAVALQALHQPQQDAELERAAAGDEPGSAVQTIEPEEAEVLDGQHADPVVPRSVGVALQDGPAEHRAGPR